MKTIVEFKDVTRFKLTVAKDSVRIKVPLNASEEEQLQVIPYLQSVADALEGTEFTFRGSYKNGTIKMERDKKCKKHSS